MTPPQCCTQDTSLAFLPTARSRPKTCVASPPPLTLIGCLGKVIMERLLQCNVCCVLWGQPEPSGVNPVTGVLRSVAEST